MDIRHFGLARPPFAATPHAACCFAHEPWQQVLDELIVRLRAGQGTCVLTSPAGLGKTLALKVVAEELHHDHCILSIPTPGVLDVPGLQQSLLAELELGRVEGSPTEQRLAIIHELRGLIRNTRPAVVLVDEAHTLSPQLLEELRTLAIQDEDGEPLARILLAGQPAFEELLAGPGFDAFNQQIACHKLLQPLALTESVEYILHRVAWAGGDPETLFSIEALDAVVRAAGGNPRLLNRACDLALLLAAARERPGVDAESMQLALDELQKLPLAWLSVSHDHHLSSTHTPHATDAANTFDLDSPSPSGDWEEPGESPTTTPPPQPPAIEEIPLTDSAATSAADPGDFPLAHSPSGTPRPAWPVAPAPLDHAEPPASPAVPTRLPFQPGSDTAGSPRRASAQPVAKPMASERTGHAVVTPRVPEEATPVSWATWPPYVPTETSLVPGQDPFDGFEPIPTISGDSDLVNEWRWLLPNTPHNGPTPSPTSPPSQSTPFSPPLPADGGLASPRPTATETPGQKFETFVEPPVGVARLPLGMEPQRTAPRISISPANRATDDAPALARRQYGLRGNPQAGLTDGGAVEEFDVVEPEPPTTEDRGNERADFIAPPSPVPDRQTSRTPTAEPLTTSLGDSDRGPETTPSLRRPGTGDFAEQSTPAATSATRRDPEHPTPSAPRVARTGSGSGEPPRGLGRLFSALRGRTSPPRD